MSDFSSKVHNSLGGDTLVVESGGAVQVLTGGKIVTNSGTQAAAIANITPATDGTSAGTALNLVLAALRGVGIIAP
jgi:hypothetical protein